MSDTPVNRPTCRVPHASPLRHVAVQQILGITLTAVNRDEKARPGPAKVYPASGGGQAWVVEPPSWDEARCGDRRTFDGVAALPEALEYAHQTYGGARCLSR
jgi:hypothetical protein